MSQTTIDLALPSAVGNVTINALDQNGSSINQVTLTASGSPTIWGQFKWGAAPWLGTASALQPYQIPWTEPIVFARMYTSITCASAFGLKIGALHMRYQQLRTYTNTAAAA